MAPLDNLNPEPWLEINVPHENRPGSPWQQGAVIQGTAYDDRYGGNLTNMYYFSHGGFEEPKITIRDVTKDTLTLEITGENEGSPVVLYAAFRLNPERERSIT